MNHYYTEPKPLILPEYGRNVQNMVDYCMTLDDRVERQQCAQTIIKTMDFFSKKQKDREDYWQVLWDHLFIMSDFKLDIDFPCEVITKETYLGQGDRYLENNHQKRPIYRHYGRTIERMIEATVAETDLKIQSLMAKEVALQMKKSYIQWNKETVANTKIFSDLFELSKGKIYLDESTCSLPDTKELQVGTSPANNNVSKKRKINVRRKNHQ